MNLEPQWFEEKWEEGGEVDDREGERGGWKGEIPGEEECWGGRNKISKGYFQELLHLCSWDLPQVHEAVFSGEGPAGFMIKSHCGVNQI